MSDYDLSGLSPRSFEHLILSLALGAISRGVTPFGSGPDGVGKRRLKAPRLTLEGIDPWVGYGVLQAKFRERPRGTESDGKWILKQLDDEITSPATHKSEEVG